MKKAVFLLLIALLIILPTSLASDNEACEFTNCACRFFLDDDISRGLLIESCKACIKSANPYVCTGCLSWAGGLSLGCGTYTHATDDYYTGLNYCSAERVAFNLIEAGIDLLPGAIPTDEASLLLDIVEKATSEMNGWILDELKEEYATQEIDCREYINLPPLQFIDIETNPYGSEYIDVFDPGVPTPTEPFTFTTKVYNMGQRERLIDNFFVKFTLKRRDGNAWVVVEEKLTPVPNPNLGPSQFVDVSATFQPTQQEGTYFVKVFADAGENIDEQDQARGITFESNNVYSSHEFTISNFRGPDLTVKDITINNANPLETYPTYATANIRNIGHEDVYMYGEYMQDPAYVGCYLDNEPTGTGYFFSQLAPNSEFAFSCPIPGNVAPGAHSLKIKTILLNGALEELTTNNEQTVYFTLSPRIPSAPSLHDPILSETSANLVWDPITDTHINSVDVYYCQGSCTLATTLTDVNTNQYEITGLNDGEYYHFKIAVTNSLSHTTYSNQVGGATVASATIDFVTPTFNQTLSSTESITFNVTDLQDQVDLVELYYMDYNLAPGESFSDQTINLIGTSTSSPWTISWDTTTIPQSHKIELMAYAKSGTNTLALKNTYVQVNNNPTSTITVSDSTSGGTATLTATTNWLEDFDEIIFYLGTTQIAQVSKASNHNNQQQTYTTTFDTTQFNDGTYILNVKAFDGSYLAASGTAQLTIANTGEPTITLTQPIADGSDLSGTITLEAQTQNALANSADSVEFYFVNNFDESQATLLGTDSNNNDETWTLTYNTLNLCTSTCSGNIKAALKQSQITLSESAFAYNINNGNQQQLVAEISNPTQNEVVSGTISVTLDVTTDYLGLSVVEFHLETPGQTFPGYLGAATSSPWTINWDTTEISDGDNYRIIAYADSETIYSGYFDIDNSVPVDQTVGDPDFIISSSTLDWEPDIIIDVGQTNNFKLNIKNIATAAAQTHVRWCLQKPNDPYPVTMLGGADNLWVTIEPDQTHEITSPSITIPETGSYLLRVAVDGGAYCGGSWPGDNRNAESNENNNVEDFSFTVEEPTVSVGVGEMEIDGGAAKTLDEFLDETDSAPLTDKPLPTKLVVQDEEEEVEKVLEISGIKDLSLPKEPEEDKSKKLSGKLGITGFSVKQTTSNSFLFVLGFIAIIIIALIAYAANRTT